jgi:hypothetical protein
VVHQAVSPKSVVELGLALSDVKSPNSVINEASETNLHDYLGQKVCVCVSIANIMVLTKFL